MSVTKTIGKAAVTAASAAGLAVGATSAGLMADVMWPSAVPGIRQGQTNAAFFASVGAIGSLGADIASETVLKAIVADGAANEVTTMAVAPLVAAGSAALYLKLMDANALAGAFVTPVQVLGVVAAGELLGRYISEKIPQLQ